MSDTASNAEVVDKTPELKEDSADGTANVSTEEDSMPTKENHKDASSVYKRHRSDTSLPEIKNLDYLLVADGTMDGIPLHLENILKHFEGTTLSQAELIFLIAYAVSLESGFVSQEGYEESERYLIRPSPTASYHSKNVLRLSRIPPKYVKMEDSIRFSLKLYTFVDLKETSPDEIYSLLVGFVSGDFLILSLSPANTTGARGYSIALSIGRYVLATHRKDKPLFQRFRKLDELSLFLRDSLFTPMRNQHLRSLEAYMYPSLEGIPPEMYDNILKYLNRNQLRILLNVNKTLYNLTACSKHMLKYL